MPTMLDLFKGSPQDRAVKRGKETFGTQESDGIRVSTLVEANNPLIYGTGAIRIANRSIETTEIQKDGTGISPDGGLVGEGLGRLTGGRVNSLSEVRTAITSKLGLPQKLIPTRIASNDDFIQGKEPDTIITLSQIRQDGAGTALGQFLKSTGGGNPQTLGKQAVGKGIGVVKDKLRERAFGGQQTVGQLTGKPLDTNYSSQQTYSDVLTSEGRNIYNEGGEASGDEVNVRFGNASTDKIDLRSVSPIFGIRRSDDKFGKSNNAYTFKNRVNETLPTINPINTYSNVLTSEDRNIYDEGGEVSVNDSKVKFANASTDKIDLKSVSPLFGTRRPDDKFGKSNNAYTFKNRVNETLPIINPTNTYSDVLTSDGRNIYNEGGEVSVNDSKVKFANASTDKIDLKSVSPLFGVRRPDDKFGKSNNAYTFKNRVNETLPTINPTNTYSDVVIGEDRNIYDEGGTVSGNEVNVRFANTSNDKIDLRLVSPIYGIERPENKFGKGNSAYTFRNRENETLPTINPTNTYLESLGRKETTPLDTDRRFSGLGEGDGINQTGVNDNYDDREIEGYNLIPFWIKTVDAQKAVHFRTIIDGISEQVSPSWSDNNFLGNPYKYYTYQGVERELSFNLKIYCMNPTELAKNWEKIQYLTSKTYPFIPTKDGKKQSFFDAPFIRFRLGNMYVNKVAFISSLNYTIDDNTPWETEIDGFYLPKFVSVAIGMKLVESEGAENALYNYERSREAIEQIRESREATVERRQALATSQERQEVPRVTVTGGTSTTPPSPRKAKSSQGGEVDTPRESRSQSTLISQPNIEKLAQNGE